jgi:hypothetical protein
LKRVQSWHLGCCEWHTTPYLSDHCW